MMTISTSSSVKPLGVFLRSRASVITTGHPGEALRLQRDAAAAKAASPAKDDFHRVKGCGICHLEQRRMYRRFNDPYLPGIARPIIAGLHARPDRHQMADLG